MDESPTSTSRAGIAVAGAAVIAVLLLLAALFDLGPFADEELTAEEFVAQGDEICKQAHDEFRSLQDRTIRTPSDAADLTGALIDVAEEELDAISELSEPESLSDPVERYLKARERGIDLLEEGRDAAEDGDSEAYERLQAELASSQIDPRFAIAREIGFGECSKPLVSRSELRRQAQAPSSADLTAPPQVDNPPAAGP